MTNEIETKIQAEEVTAKAWVVANKKPLTAGFAAGILLMVILIGIAHAL